MRRLEWKWVKDLGAYEATIDGVRVLAKRSKRPLGVLLWRVWSLGFYSVSAFHCQRDTAARGVAAAMRKMGESWVAA